MIKRMGLFKKREDLNLSQFSSYWAKKHSPLVVKMPKFITYIQNHKVDILPNFVTNHPTFHLDGIAEMYWYSEKDMFDDFDSPNGIEILRQDESEFMSHISVCIVEEAVLEGKQSAIKIVMCLGNGFENVDVISLKKVLPNLRGFQRSDVLQIMKRPHLPEILNVPHVFVNMWFDNYEQVLKDFTSDAWKTYYQSDMGSIDRLSLDIFHSIQIRN